MLGVLQGLGTWRWNERNNDRFGEYISASALTDPEWGIVKIFVEPDHFAINIDLESNDSGAQPRFDAVLETIFKAAAACDRCSRDRRD